MEKARLPMRICLVESRESDLAAHSETCEGASLTDAIARAKVLMTNIELVPPKEWNSDVIGFVVYDDAGRIVHREYLEGK
jgi:hypothetical protein